MVAGQTFALERVRRNGTALYRRNGGVSYLWCRPKNLIDAYLRRICRFRAIGAPVVGTGAFCSLSALDSFFIEECLGERSFGELFSEE